MSLESQLNTLLNTLLTAPSSKEQLIQSIDLTLLDESASDDALEALVSESRRYPLACVCVYAKHLPWFQSVPVNLATVVNFPRGDESIEACLNTIEEACHQNVHEIDYVFAYSLYLNNQKQEALAHCEKIIKNCKEKGLTVKIILETCAFPTLESLYEACFDLLKLEPDFLKTSTGKASHGATLAAAFTMISAIKDSQSSCGLKISGGIKHTRQAFSYVQMAQLLFEKEIDPSWFRVGASSLLKELGN